MSALQRCALRSSQALQGIRLIMLLFFPLAAPPTGSRVIFRPDQPKRIGALLEQRVENSRVLTAIGTPAASQAAGACLFDHPVHNVTLRSREIH